MTTAKDDMFTTIRSAMDDPESSMMDILVMLRAFGDDDVDRYFKDLIRSRPDRLVDFLFEVGMRHLGESVYWRRQPQREVHPGLEVIVSAADREALLVPHGAVGHAARDGDSARQVLYDLYLGSPDGD